MGTKAKYDYDSDTFYKEVEILASKGFNDAEISDILELTPSVFSKMKNGSYEGWNDDQNKERSSRLSQVLARARRKINSIARGTYLKAAIGGKKVKTITRRFLEVECECLGNDKNCKICGGVGRVPISDKAIIQENEQELAPNIQALSTWLFHHDEEWKKSVIEGKKLDITTGGEKINQVTIFELPDNGRDKD